MRNKKDDSQKREDELFRQFFNYLIDKYEKDNGIKFNQTKFSDSIHCSKSLIGKWRTGVRNIPRDYYYAIGEYFGISVDTYLDVKKSYGFEIFDVSAKERGEKYKFLKYYPIDEKWITKELNEKNINLSIQYLNDLLNISKLTSKNKKYTGQEHFLREALKHLEYSVNLFYPASLGYEIDSSSNLYQEFIVNLQEQITMYIVKNGKGDPKELENYYIWKNNYEDFVNKTEIEFKSYEAEFLDEVIKSHENDFSQFKNYSAERLLSKINDILSKGIDENTEYYYFLLTVSYERKSI